MPISFEHISPDLHLAIWDFTESESDIEKALSIVPPTEKAHLKSFKRKMEFVGTRWLLAHLMRREPCILYKTSGQPYLLDSDFYLSITHSYQKIGVALSIKPVGIDIEKIDYKLFRTKEKYCSKKELSHISENQLLYHLALHWSAKESVYKLFGDQSFIFDRDLQIDEFTPKLNGEFNFNVDGLGVEQQLQIHYQKIDDFVLTFCWLNT